MNVDLDRFEMQLTDKDHREFHTFAYKFLIALAEEVRCKTDPDLMFMGSSNDIMVFMGTARKCWVHYVDSATVRLSFPAWGHTEIINLENPKSLERLEKIFHDNTWTYLSGGCKGFDVI